MFFTISLGPKSHSLARAVKNPHNWVCKGHLGGRGRLPMSYKKADYTIIIFCTSKLQSPLTSTIIASYIFRKRNFYDQTVWC